MSTTRRFPTLRISSSWLALALLPVMALAQLAVVHPAEAQARGRLSSDPHLGLGLTEDGRPQLHARGFGNTGSSHWDPRATPDLLMEPSLTDLEAGNLDITPALMEDLGWSRGTSSFEIMDVSLPGTGFDDPAPFAGAPGNPATTLGEARRNAFEAAFGIWGETLASDVPIDVVVLWDELFCVSFGAVLGAAGALGSERDLPGLPVSGVLYPQALAEALVGENLSAPGGADILVVINSALDTGCLGEGTGWYYGLDGNESPTEIDLLPVLLHELGHGLGMASNFDPSTGEQLNGAPGIYDTLLLDTLSGKTFDEMTDRERLFAAGHDGRVAWNGPRATVEAQALLEGGGPRIEVLEPAALAGSFPAGPAAFGPRAEPPVEGPIVCLLDEVADPSHLNGCTEARNPEQLAGAIALVDLGDCAPSQKVAQAQEAGAVGVWLVSHGGNALPLLGGFDEGIQIPAASIPAPLGTRLRQEICPETAAYLAGGRFQISATWETLQGTRGSAVARPLTPDTTTFYFFDPDNVELIVKVIDACGLQGFDNFWTFAAGLTNVGVVLSVIDTETESRRVFDISVGRAFPPIQDTVAFQTCPP